MGRPEKTKADALTSRVAFRVTEAERFQIEAAAAAAGVSVSDYARALVATARPPRASRDKIAASVLAELNRVGVNLNQIARHLNRNPAGVPAALSDAIAEVRAAVERLAEGKG